MASENIFQQYLKPVKSMQEYMDENDAREKNGLELAAVRQAAADDKTYRAVAMEAGGDQNALVKALLSKGLVKQAQAAQTSGLGNKKTVAEINNLEAGAGNKNADTEAKKQELRMKKYEQALKDIAGFQTPEEAAISLKAHMDAGDVDPVRGQTMLQSIPQDPSKFAAWQLGMLRNIMAAKDQVALVQPDANTVANNTTSRANNTATNETSRANNAATVAATQRGQDMEKTKLVQSDNGPLVVNMHTGQGKSVLGTDGQQLPGVTKPLNDSQSKALLFGTRMQQAHKVLDQLSKEGTTSSVPGSRAPIVGGAITAMSSANQQMLDQAKRDFMTAVLRRESGASISTGEFETADKQYFPQIGDSKAVIAQKARNRKLAIDGILAEVPEKQRGSITPAEPAVPTVSNW
jgi:hypothetical protein